MTLNNLKRRNSPYFAFFSPNLIALHCLQADYVTVVEDGPIMSQTWSSRDLSLGLETSQNPFLQVLVSVLVLEPQSLGLGLGLGTLESRSRSWSWNLVLVLEPSSLGLGLGLGTWDHEDSVFTALHAMQTRSSDENSVRLSVCLSVCHTRDL